MSRIDSLHPGMDIIRIDPHSTISERELVELDQKFEIEDGKRGFEYRYKDKIDTTHGAAYQPLPPVALSRKARDKKLYRQDSIGKAPAPTPTMGMVNLLPTVGVPKLVSPQDLSFTIKKSQDEKSLTIKTATTEGFLNTVKNFFYNMFGWDTTPAGDTTGETPLAGSPKEQVFSPRDQQLMSQAIEAMALALTQRIKASEQAKENSPENGDRESETIQLKQVLNELQILKRIINAMKGSVSSKEFQVQLAAESITKNFEKHKEIQGKHLENAREIEAGNKREEWLLYLQYGATGVGVTLLLITGGFLLAGLPTPLILTLGSGAAGFANAGATGFKIDQERKTGGKKAENEGYDNTRRQLQDAFKSFMAEESRSIRGATTGQKRLIELSQEKMQNVRAAAQQLNR